MPSKYGAKVVSFYHSARWAKAKRLALAHNHGLCERCGRKPSTDVHHIVPLTDSNVDDPSIATDEKNLMGLCKECHDAIRHEGDGEKGKARASFDKDGNVTIT